MSDRIRIYRWLEVKGHLELDLSNVHRKMEACTDHDELLRLQGEARVLRRLLNLPETLSFLLE